jgi:hypothetical protein
LISIRNDSSNWVITPEYDDGVTEEDDYRQQAGFDTSKEKSPASPNRFSSSMITVERHSSQTELALGFVSVPYEWEGDQYVSSRLLLPGNVKAKDCKFEILRGGRKAKLSIERSKLSNNSLVALGAGMNTDKNILQAFHQAHDKFVKTLKTHDEDEIWIHIYIDVPFRANPNVSYDVPNLPGKGLLPLRFQRDKPAVNVFFFTLKKLSTGYSSVKKVIKSVNVGRRPIHEAPRTSGAAQAEAVRLAQAEAARLAQAEAARLVQEAEEKFRAAQAEATRAATRAAEAAHSEEVTRAVQVAEAEAARLAEAEEASRGRVVRNPQAAQSVRETESSSSSSSSGAFRFGRYSAHLPQRTTTLIPKEFIEGVLASPGKKRKVLTKSSPKSSPNAEIMYNDTALLDQDMYDAETHTYW